MSNGRYQAQSKVGPLGTVAREAALQQGGDDGACGLDQIVEIAIDSSLELSIALISRGEARGALRCVW